MVKKIVALILFVVASIYITYPLVWHIGDYANGEYVIAWILNWNIHSILTGNILHIYNANIFYPYTNTIAYSDTLFTSSILALPFFLFIHEPMVASNVTFLSSLVLLGFCTYLLSYILTKNFLASILSGTLIIFSPMVLDKRVHLQILSIWWIPLSLYFFFLYKDTKKYRYVLIALMCFYLQSINNFMAGYFIVFSFAMLLAYEFIQDKEKATKLFVTKRNLIAVTITFLAIVPIALPYFVVSHQLHFIRDIREAIHLSLQPEDLIVGNEFTRIQPVLTYFQNPANYPANAEIKPGYLGLVFSLLTIVTTIYWIVQRKKSPRYGNVFLLIAFFGLVLSLGPALHWGRKTIHHPFLIPLPYALFYYVLPGFQGFRNAARFEMLFALFSASAIGIYLSQILKKLPKLLAYMLLIVLVFGTVIEFHTPMQFAKAPTFKQFPKVYAWIRAHTPESAVILELPIYNWDNNPFGDNREVLREYYSISHFRRLISGGSGFSPQNWQQFAIGTYAGFPSQNTLQGIKLYGAQYVIVHKNEFDILHASGYLYRGKKLLDGNTVLDVLSQSSLVTLITKVGDDYVYKIQ